MERADQALDVPLRLQVGTVASAVVVTASRAERDTRQIPLHVEAITKTAVEQSNQLSTGDALTLAANITPVGNGPVRCPAAPARPGLDAPAGAGRRRAAEHGASGDRSHRRRGGAGLSGLDQPDGGRQWRRHPDVRLGCAGRHHQHHHERSRVHAPGRSGCTGSTASTAPTRTACAGRGPWESPRRGSPCASRAGAEDYDNYQAGELDSEDTRPLFASGVLDRADTIDDNFGFRFNAFPGSLQRALRAHRQRGAQLAGARELRQRHRQHQGRRSPVGPPAVPAPPDGRRRLPGLCRAVFLQRDGAAAQQPRPRVGSLRGTGNHAVACQPVGDVLLPAHRAPAAEHAAGAVSSAHGGRVLPDQRDAAGHPVRDRAAGLDARRRPPGGLRAREQAPAHDRPHVLPRSQQRSTHHDDHDLDGGAGRPRIARPGARGLSEPGSARARRRRRTPSACRMRAFATSRSSRRTSGVCGPTSHWSQACAATSSTCRPRPPRATTSTPSSPARGRRSIRRRCRTPTGPPTPVSRLLATSASWQTREARSARSSASGAATAIRTSRRCSLPARPPSAASSPTSR